jgi:uncharacterized SAM-binding protein YcdF (DUF218 family)
MTEHLRSDMPAKHVRRRLLVLLIVLTLLAGAGLWAFRRAGRWLVIEDSLQRARAIVVLSGLCPYRAMEAAEIYRQGWAPEVWLFQDDPRGAEDAFARLGIHYVTEEEWDQQVLERLGVPATAIRVLDTPTTNTVSETDLVASELRRMGGDRVILVTSPLHTRRAKAIWRSVVGDYPQAILRYDAFEPTDPDHWWRATQDVEGVVHEVLGLINLRLGFVSKPRAE